MKENRRMHINMWPVGLANTRISTDYAKNLPDHWSWACSPKVDFWDERVDRHSPAMCHGPRLWTSSFNANATARLGSIRRNSVFVKNAVAWTMQYWRRPRQLLVWWYLFNANIVRLLQSQSLGDAKTCQPTPTFMWMCTYMENLAIWGVFSIPSIYLIAWGTSNDSLRSWSFIPKEMKKTCALEY